MKKVYNTLLCLLLLVVVSNAQKPAEMLAAWSQKFPIEKVYLHLDRDNYVAGETAWFKAYLYSDYQPDTISTSLYVELVNGAGVVINRAVVPVLLGTANGHVELADSLLNGYYIIRAYSSTMLNQDIDFAGRRGIMIYGRKNKIAELASKEKIVRLEFFPEGGNLITGFSNTIAFKATDENGLPVAVKGKILDGKNTAVASFDNYHDGMGMFELMPAADEKYYAIVEGDSLGRKYFLPEQTTKGIALTVIPHPQGSFFEIKQRKDDPAFQVAYMIGQMQHHLVFKQEFKAFKEEMQGVINTQSLHSGILQITFFNKNDQPLAERLCFVDNKEYIQQGELFADTINFLARGKNRFSLQLKDTVQGSFSVSITDPEYSLLTEREENIFSGLLLTSDLKGYVHKPAYYFSADNDSVKTALDLVMMTNGWRRFKWTELSQQVTRNGYKDGSYITLSGQVNIRDTKRPFAEKPLLLLLITADSTRSMHMLNTDKYGYFRLDSMLFFGRSRILFSDIRGRKSQFIDVSLAADSLTRTFVFAQITPAYKRTDLLFAAGPPKIGIDYEAILKAAGVMMQGVTVKTKKKNPVQELEERYASGAFSGDATKTIDLVNNKDAAMYQNIFDYLQMKVPGLQVTRDGLDYQVYYRQGHTASSMGDIPMVLFLDEIETDASFISTIPAGQIAMVKLFNSFVAASGNGAGGTLAIYTKKDADMNDIMRHAASIVKYNGYCVVKEFYAPDYAINIPAATQADTRITLDWRPSIFLNNVNPKVPLTFYNNDRTKSFKIVIEGMTLDGKMLMIEKTISSNSKGF